MNVVHIQNILDDVRDRYPDIKFIVIPADEIGCRACPSTRTVYIDLTDAAASVHHVHDAPTDDQMINGLFSILYHEIGHVVLNHKPPDYFDPMVGLMETEAWMWAIEHFSNIDGKLVDACLSTYSRR